MIRSTFSILARSYRSDDADGNLEFVGKNRIEHTPKHEKVRVQTGTAFEDFKASFDEK